MMADVSLELIGAELQRLQADVLELRLSVDQNNRETRARYDLLRDAMNRHLADIEIKLSARMDGFDERFA